MQHRLKVTQYQLTCIGWRLHCSHLNMVELYHILTRLQQLQDPNLSLQVLTHFRVLFEVALTHSLDRHLFLSILGRGDLQTHTESQCLPQVFQLTIIAYTHRQTRETIWDMHKRHLSLHD